MNLLKRRITRKTWLLIISSFILLGVIALIIMTLKGSNTSKTQESVSVQDQPKTMWEENIPDQKQNNEQVVESTEKGTLNIVVPTEVNLGKVMRYTDKSTSAILLVKDESKETKYELQVTGIVFDGSKNKVVRPSEIAVGESVKVFSAGKELNGLSTAEVVMLNVNKSAIYLPISSVTTSNGRFQISGGVSNKVYTLSEDTKVQNALSGLPYRKEDLKMGDRSFLYLSKSVSTDKNNQLTVDSIYVYPRK